MMDFCLAAGAAAPAGGGALRFSGAASAAARVFSSSFSNGLSNGFAHGSTCVRRVDFCCAGASPGDRAAAKSPGGEPSSARSVPSRSPGFGCRLCRSGAGASDQFRAVQFRAASDPAASAAGFGAGGFGCSLRPVSSTRRAVRERERERRLRLGCKHTASVAGVGASAGFGAAAPF
jgi:hypothetical protein